MKIREVSAKAENLKEVGREAEERHSRAMSNLQNARQRVAMAEMELSRASETDEEGNPAGDVSYARAALDSAIMDMEYYEDEVAEAEADIEQINGEKLETIQTLDEYYEGESGNLSIVEQLRSKQFGGNVAGLAAAIVAQMNLAESTKADLYKSMGMNYTARTTGSAGSQGSIGGIISGIVSTATSPSVKYWTGQLEQLSNRLRGIYSTRYAGVISDKKLNQPLSKTVRYESREMFNARGMEPGVLGYNNGIMSRIVAGTGFELQTTVHENLHQLSANGNKRGICYVQGKSRKNVQLNEAITEMLTQRTLGDEYGSDYSLYSGNRDAMVLLESVMGENVVSEAYFQNKPELMQQEFERVMGQGSWEQMSEAFDDSVSKLEHTRQSGCVRRDYWVSEYVKKANSGGSESWKDLL